jgi:hypothetical protein
MFLARIVRAKARSGCVSVFVLFVWETMCCAERTGTGMMLWVHEFYMVIEADPGRPSSVPLPYVYQALEFKHGGNLDQKEVEGWKKKKKNKIWDCGVAYAPEFHVRKFNNEKMREGYLFHTE